MRIIHTYTYMYRQFRVKIFSIVDSKHATNLSLGLFKMYCILGKANFTLWQGLWAHCSGILGYTACHSYSKGCFVGATCQLLGRITEGSSFWRAVKKDLQGRAMYIFCSVIQGIQRKIRGNKIKCIIWRWSKQKRIWGGGSYRLKEKGVENRQSLTCLIFRIPISLS